MRHKQGMNKVVTLKHNKQSFTQVFTIAQRRVIIKVGLTSKTHDFNTNKEAEKFFKSSITSLMNVGGWQITDPPKKKEKPKSTDSAGFMKRLASASKKDPEKFLIVAMLLGQLWKEQQVLDASKVGHIYYLRPGRESSHNFLIEMNPFECRELALQELVEDGFIVSSGSLYKLSPKGLTKHNELLRKMTRGEKKLLAEDE